MVAARHHFQALEFADLDQLSGFPVSKQRAHVVVVGAHPDDPETGCGGTIAKFIAAGHRVSIVYLTRGEAGLKGQDAGCTASVRTTEAIAAAADLGAEPVFAGQIDGQTSTDEKAASDFIDLIVNLKPDVVLTHWGEDTHHDHRVCAELTRAAWAASDYKFSLAYYEVMAGIQTQNFEPTAYIDVADFEQIKRQAVYRHNCQNPDRFYPYHVEMERKRGDECGLVRAEAFVVAKQPAKVLQFPNA